MVDRASTIIKSQYLTEFDQFYQQATNQEQRGYDWVVEIVRGKGRLRVGDRRKEQAPRGASLSRFDILNQTALHYRSNQLRTSYQTTFGLPSKQDISQTIFKFKSVSDTDYVRILTGSAQLFIDSWIQLKDKAEYQEDVLAFLRAVYAKLATKLPPSTQMKSNYVKRTDWSLSQPIRMDSIGADINRFKPNQKAIQKQRQKDVKLKKKLQELQNSDLAKQLKIFKQFKIN